MSDVPWDFGDGSWREKRRFAEGESPAGGNVASESGEQGRKKMKLDKGKRPAKSSSAPAPPRTGGEAAGGSGERGNAGLDLPSLSMTVINDPVHGHMEFHPLCVKIMDTPQFQRLRNLKQLGCAYLVYPGASHNRFEHSLGVSYLAMKVASTLKLRQPELDITDEDILCVAIAGLCHDLGHGPFSHLFEDIVHQSNPHWTHEEASKRMFCFIWDDPKTNMEIKKYLKDEHKAFIENLITGHKSDSGEKGFLYEIVANERNGIDVDKWDYMARDSLMTGMPNSFDHRRLMKHVRAIKHEGEWMLCTRDKEVANVYEMFKQRHFMTVRVYSHRVVRCIDEMIKDAFSKLEGSNDITFPGERQKPFKVTECVKDMQAFTLLDDTVLNRILATTSEGLRESREILQRISRRELYRLVAETHPMENVAEQQEQDKQIREFKEEGFIVKRAPLSYEKKKENPVDKMRFYSKKSPDEAVEIPKEEVSFFLPSVYAEETIRLISKKREVDQRCRDVVAKFKSRCEECGVKIKTYID